MQPTASIVSLIQTTVLNFTKLYHILAFLKANNMITLHKKMKLSIKDFFSKCDQIRRKLRFGHIYRGNAYRKTSFFVQC